MNDLVTVERELMPTFAPVMSTFAQLLPASIPPERLMRTIVVSCMNLPKLLECNRQSLINAALSAASLGVECDGSGQGYLLPYKGKAQLIVGYKGYTVIAARSGWSLEGFVVREGEPFTFDEANGLVSHQRTLGGEKDRRLIAAYAVARKPGFSTMVRVLSDDQVREIRGRSQSGNSSYSPWKTDYDKMARKSAIRALANDVPLLSIQQASALDVQHELGNVAHIAEDGTVRVDVVAEPAEPRESRPQPGTEILDGEIVEEATDPWRIWYPGGGVKGYDDLRIYAEKMPRAIALCPGDRIAEFRDLNQGFIAGPVKAANETLAVSLLDAFAAALSSTGGTT